MKSRTTQEDLDFFRSREVGVIMGPAETNWSFAEPAGLILASMKAGKELFDRFAQLRVVASFGVGFDNIDVREATKRGIIVFNVPDLFTNAVANLTIGLILCVTRKVLIADRGVREDEWTKIKPHCVGVDMQGKVLGLIGLGNIGRAVANKCISAFNVKVIGFDPWVSVEKAREFNVKNVEKLEEVLSESDIVSIHCPLTDDTRGLIGAKELASMKSTSYLVNTSRGGIVDELALFRALQNGKIAGAALDVMESEPPSPDNPLLRLENVVLTPHIGASSIEGIRAVYRTARENVCRVLDGDLPEYPAKVVNESAPSSLK